MKHTPGPWYAQSIRLTDTWTVKAADGFQVCRVVPRMHGPMIADGPANARLIAAAPEMLEALKAARASLRNSVRDGEGGMAREVNLGIIEAAIARAEGR